MKKNVWFQFKGPLLCILAAIVWGSTFIVQDVASETVRPFTYNGIRMLLGSGILFSLSFLLRRKNKKGKPLAPVKKKTLLLAGAVCGVLLFAAANFQQAGFTAGTPAGKGAFITALYVVLVPIIGLLVGKRTKKWVWIGVAFAAVGMYLMCMADFSLGLRGSLSAFSLSRGDFFCFCSSICFSLHIMAVAYFVPRTDGVLLSAMQFLVAGSISFVLMLVLERPDPSAVLSVAFYICYAALFGGLGYTFQILGQRDTDLTLASILLCMEAVFGLLFDSIFLKNPMATEELIGCAVMFVAILIASTADLGDSATSE